VPCLRFEEWPELDQRLWTESCAPVDKFDDPGYGSTLREASLLKTRKGYGRWLDFLARRGELDPASDPFDRVTRTRLACYLRDLKAVGNADHTIIGRFGELARAIRILAPDRDSSFIRKPFGQTIYAILRRRKRTLVIPHPLVLRDWAVQLIAAADTKKTVYERLCGFRDGLLILFLCTCGRRLRSVSLMRLGKEIFRTGDHYRVEFRPDQTKTNKTDRFNLPAAFTPHIDRYINEIRPALLAGRPVDNFWIGAGGGPWTAKAIQSQCLALSAKRFGTAFGTHRIRHSIATFAPHMDPANPALGAAVLGISKEVCQDAYNRGGQAHAARLYQEYISELRASLPKSGPH
jgi:hypothetical protein